MDLFRKHFFNMINKNAGIVNQDNIMPLLVTSIPMLHYIDEKYKALRFMSNLMFRMGHLGETYHALNLLPPSELKECAPILNAIENPGYSKFTFNLEIITKCNLRCPMCSHGEGRTYDYKGQVMPFERFKHIYDKIKNITNLLVLVGQGETFLHPDIYKILEYSCNTPVYIDTNANIKLDTEKIINSNIQTLVFSVDGIDQRMHSKYRIGGNFDRVIQNITSIVEAKIKYGKGPILVFKNIVFKHNEAYLQDVKSLCTSLGLDRLQITPCHCIPEQGEEIIKEFIPVGQEATIRKINVVDFTNDFVYLTDELESPYCNAPFNNPNINIQGLLTPCCSNVTPIGSLLDMNFDSLWRSATYRDIRLNALKNRYNLEWCKTCSRGQQNFGHLFDGTIMEYPKRNIYSDNYLDLRTLNIDKKYMEYLISNNLSKDIEYYKKSNSLSEEALLMLN